ncbi:hypothetical protein Poly30_11040 [Planctomycetes bacterium Poly30]|uniref:DUF7305 domain-containing protein n=1 Tax=Saltatorellus ferox TaxID=2528018 RepID=A0A518ENE4_9BACT|nr:hypothetical protein Poly30_11040 [Planctomycetes bacterium Poly30]
MRRSRQGGFALVLSLILVTVVSGLCIGFVRLAVDTSRSQTGSVDQMRAFYLAEAGLAEAFHAVRMGRSGRIGSEASAASYGDGLIWVQSAQTPDDRVWLRATATVGGGRAVLGLIVEPDDPPLGFFADEDIVFEAPLLVDGFDSSERTYEAEVDAILASQPPVDPPVGDFFVVDPGSPHYEGQIAANYMAGVMGATELLAVLTDQMTYERYPILIGSMEWLLWPSPRNLEQVLSSSDYNEFLDTAVRMRQALDAGALTSVPGGVVPMTGGEMQVRTAVEPPAPDVETGTVSSDGVSSYSGSTGTTAAADTTDTSPSLDPSAAIRGSLTDTHTDRGGLIGSNGDIAFVGEAANSAIFGSVIPGVDGTVVGLAEGAVSGTTDPRAMAVHLKPVLVPPTVSTVDLDHAGLIPEVVAPGTTGIGTLRVAGGSEVIVRGPATLVIADLLLEGGSTLTLDTRDGAVEIYITGSLDMDPASFVETTGIVASEVSIMAGAVSALDAPPELALDAVSTFRGTVYAPESTVHIGPDFEIFGGVACKRLEIASGAKLHFDDETYNGVLAVPTQDSWRILELPPSTRRPPRNAIAGAAAAPGAGHPPLADAHGLDDVELSIRYTDTNGVAQSYAGPESAFDWDAVASVEAQERAATMAQVDFQTAPGAPSSATSAGEAAAEDGSGSGWGSAADREAMLQAVRDWLAAQDWSAITGG